MNWLIIKKGLQEWFRIWEMLFLSYIIIFTLSTIGGYNGGILFNSIFNSIIISSIYYLLCKIRIKLIMKAKSLENIIQNKTSIGHKIIDKTLQEYDKKREEEKNE